MADWQNSAAITTGLGGTGAAIGAWIANFLLAPKDSLMCKIEMAQGMSRLKLLGNVNSAFILTPSCQNFLGFRADGLLLDQYFLTTVGGIIGFLIFFIGARLESAGNKSQKLKKEEKKQ